MNSSDSKKERQNSHSVDQALPAVSEPSVVRKIFKGASIYGIGEVLVKASGFFLIPVYTRVLTPAEYGIIGYLQVFLQIATVIVGFGAQGAQTRYYYEPDSNPATMGRFALSINLFPLAFAVVVALPLSILGSILGWTIGSSHIPFAPYMVLTLWTIVLQVMANNAISWYRARQQFTVAMALQVTRFVSITGFTLLLILAFDLSALGRIGGIAAGMVLSVLIGFSGYARNFRWPPSRSALRYAALFGAPVTVHLLAGALHNAIDRIILEHFVVMAELGIYTLAYSIGNTFMTFLIAFNQAYQPTYYELMASGEATQKYGQVLETFRKWLWLTAAGIILAVYAGEPFLRVFAGSQFHGTLNLFPLFVLSSAFVGLYFFFATPIQFHKKNHYMPLITGTSVIVNMTLNLLLIPHYGIEGAAVATVISHFWMAFVAYFVGRRFEPIPWPIGRVLFWGITIIVAVIGSVLT